MKKAIVLILLFISFNSFSQNGFQVNTLDSIVSNTGSQGAYALTAVEHSQNIHLAYIYGSTESKWYLKYEVRNNGQRISMEDVQEFSDAVWVGATTAIQFDADQNPHIYLSCVIGNQTKTLAFSRSSGEWSGVDLDFKGRNTWLSSSVNGSNGLGFATYRGGEDFNNYQPIIEYFGYEEGGWTRTTISSSSFLKSGPVAFHSSGNDKYVAYMEANPTLDTTTLFVHKFTEGGWIADFVHSYPTGGIGTYWIKFGEFGGFVHMLHPVKNIIDPSDCNLRYLTKTGGAWEYVNFTNCDAYGGVGLFNGTEVEFDSRGDIYWVDFDAVRGINSSKEYLEFKSPGRYSFMDFVIQDRTIYIYYIAGDKNWPYGDVLTFYEAVGNLSELTNATTIHQKPFELTGFYPNPGNGDYRLTLNSDRQAEIVIDWIDLQGRTISNHQIFNVQAGKNTMNLKIDGLSKGLYFIRISANGTFISIPFVQQ